MRNVRLFWQIFPACVGITLLATVLIAWLATTTGHSFFLHHLEGEIRERALLLEPTITILSKGDPERFAEFVRQCLEFVGTPGDQDQIVAGSGKAASKRLTDAAGRTGHEYAFLRCGLCHACLRLIDVVCCCIVGATIMDQIHLRPES